MKCKTCKQPLPPPEPVEEVHVVDGIKFIVNRWPHGTTIETPCRCNGTTFSMHSSEGCPWLKKRHAFGSVRSTVHKMPTKAQKAKLVRLLVAYILTDGAPVDTRQKAYNTYIGYFEKLEAAYPSIFFRSEESMKGLEREARQHV